MYMSKLNKFCFEMEHLNEFISKFTETCVSCGIYFCKYVHTYEK